jgi:fatty-acyl-CoA synthase
VVVRDRFSARRFWDDVVETECTLFQYIGELCRYLLGAPENPRERAHKLRIATGNGLRADVWTPFQERFSIPQILEFYAATENTISLYNVEGKVGAVGRVPSILAHRSPAALIRLDEGGEPLRGSDGLCVKAQVGEAGELVGRLDLGKATATFEGYTGEAENRRKVLRDVFSPGDAWLRSGDLMRTDAQGFFFFVDRLGDTFRWKGENVATAEVEAVIAQVPGVSEALVYGVAVPGAEGRAGMAALRVEPGFDLSVLREHLAANLPRYARPLFIRYVEEFERTETFKPKKRALVDEAFDPARVADALFYDDSGANAYRALDESAVGLIGSGAIPL